MMQLIGMYSSKQRTGVLDLESGLEAYIIPPCQLVERLLQTAKKSAMLATHDVASIPDAIDEAQLLLVVIHRKVSCGCCSEVCCRLQSPIGNGIISSCNYICKMSHTCA